MCLENIKMYSVRCTNYVPVMGRELSRRKKERSSKYLFIFSCIFFLYSLLHFNKVNQIIWQRNLNGDIHQETLSDGFKYILLWSRGDFYPFSYKQDGQNIFLERNCSVMNCYLTTNKSLFGDNYSKFHAIAFNGNKVKLNRTIPFKNTRSPHQKYIFFCMESAINAHVCHPGLDGFFNLTATFRLDSDIPTPYILIKDKDGNIVGPKRKMEWVKDRDFNVEYNVTKENKTKIAAWFVSKCKDKSNRIGFVQKLQKALKSYGYWIDIYGKCGTLKCPKSSKEYCGFLLKRDYYFYMSLENSFSEDYVTEKLLTALNNDVIPIVYGGADYSRFLPPGAYIDGRKFKIHQLAATMNRLVHSPEEYRRYFRWKQYYSYQDPITKVNICKLCEALNNSTLMNKTTIYKNFRTWWNPDYKRSCRNF